MGSVNGDTLIGLGQTTAAYALNGVTVNLASGAAVRSGAGASDTLTGIVDVSVSGTGDTVLGNGLANVLTASGTGDTLVAGSGNNTLLSTGAGNSLVAGSGHATLLSNGTNDLLLGNGGGATLDGAGGAGTAAVYALDHVTVALGAGTASVDGSGLSDRLIGIGNVTVVGAADTVIGDGGTDVLVATGVGDTLLGGTGTDTLVSNIKGDTLIGGAGVAIAASAVNNAIINLVSGTAGTAGSTALDTLIRVTGAEALGTGDTLIGSGGGNTLIGGTAPVEVLYAVNQLIVNLGAGTAGIAGATSADRLVNIHDVVVTGSNDTLIGAANGDTLAATPSAVGLRDSHVLAWFDNGLRW
jgi:hypothetical protein